MEFCGIRGECLSHCSPLQHAAHGVHSPIMAGFASHDHEVWERPPQSPMLLIELRDALVALQMPHAFAWGLQIPWKGPSGVNHEGGACGRFAVRSA